MNVVQLRTLLETFPDDAELGVLAMQPSGAVIDITTAPVLTIEQTLLDDGRPETVWITGVGDAPRPVPTLITWPCSCGTILTVSERDRWPAEHRRHLLDLRLLPFQPARRRRPPRSPVALVDDTPTASPGHQAAILDHRIRHRCEPRPARRKLIWSTG